MNINPKNLLKKIVFALMPLFLLLVISEVFLRVIYFQTKSQDYLALISLYQKIKFNLLLRRAESLGLNQNNRNRLSQNLFQPENETILTEVKKIYRQNLTNLVLDAQALNLKILLLYLPSLNPATGKLPLESALTRPFFTALAQELKIDFLDLSDQLLAYPPEAITLLPENGHLSRFGNFIIASELKKYLNANQTHRSYLSFSDRPKLLGDLEPNLNETWDVYLNLPYHVRTNRQGLRLNYNLEFPKTKPRVLILGDSFTFGPYLNNSDTFPYFLNRQLSDWEIINAGVIGYTISDELSLFQNRAKYSEPDFLIIQVLDNDLPGLLSLNQNIFNRQGHRFSPLPFENKLLESITSKP